MIKTSAPTSVSFTIEEFRSFLKGAFSEMRPKEFQDNTSEVYFQLQLDPGDPDDNVSENVCIRVYSSIKARSQMSRGVGEDAIRVTLFSVPNNRPLLKGTMPRINRTTGWKSNLASKIGDFIEQYSEDEQYWERLARR